MGLFASWDYPDSILQQQDCVQTAYDVGVHMGGDLERSNSSDAQAFIISAIKDPDGANLNRVQIIKGWIDQDGQIYEKIFDVAWSDDHEIKEDGSISNLTSTVDVTSATYTNDISAVSLETTWRDPEFDPATSAFYYVRVLEIPTPRWTTYDAVRSNQELSDNVPATIQERAWSSPIWLD